MNTIYLVRVEDEMGGSVACATLAEAMRLRDECRAGYIRNDGEITKLIVNGKASRRLLCNVYNRVGFVESSEVVAAPPAPAPEGTRNDE